MSVDVVLWRGRAAYVSAAGCRPTPQSKDAALTSISCKKATSLQDSPLKPGNTLSRLVCFCHRGILSRWHWTGRWGQRLGKEWRLIPRYTSVPLPLLPSHASGGYRDRKREPIFVLQRDDELLVSNVTPGGGECCKVNAGLPQSMKSNRRVSTGPVVIAVSGPSISKMASNCISLHTVPLFCVHIIAISLLNLPPHTAALLSDWIRLD